MDIFDFITLGGAFISLIGAVATCLIAINKVFDGQRCLLRSEMLKIYYKHRNEETIRQYELENFLMLYEAYKRLKGNSFIDRIAEEVKEWKVTL